LSTVVHTGYRLPTTLPNLGMKTLGSKCRDLPGRPGEARGETQRWAAGAGRWGDRTTKIGEWGKRGPGHDLPGREARGRGDPGGGPRDDLYDKLQVMNTDDRLVSHVGTYMRCM